MGRSAVAVIAAGILVGAAPAAEGADPLVRNLPWPDLLPPQPVASEAQPRPVPNCRRAGIECIAGLARRLERQWRPLDAACDHRAVPSLAYLRITEALLRDMSRRRPLYFTDKRYMAAVITTFSNRYFASFDAFERGARVPEAWRIAYEAMEGADMSAAQDVLLFSNAHVQRDLPFAYAEMGLRTRDGHSRKPDHDGVNEINFLILDRTQDEVGERYDPYFPYLDSKPSPLDEYSSMELVKLWREGAWRNAERLTAARTRAERGLVRDQIERNAAVWARFIRSFEMPYYRAQRDAHCSWFHGRPYDPTG